MAPQKALCVPFCCTEPSLELSYFSSAAAEEYLELLLEGFQAVPQGNRQTLGTGRPANCSCFSEARRVARGSSGG